jgi:hypothetical protein
MHHDLDTLPYRITSEYKGLGLNWKGEHKIRAAPPETDGPREKRICNAAGCDKVLGYQNKIGLCMMHRQGQHCRFGNCRSKLDPRNMTGYCRKHISAYKAE